MEFLFQFMSDVFTSNEDCEESQLFDHPNVSGLDVFNDEDLYQDDLAPQNIFAIADFH